MIRSFRHYVNYEDSGYAIKMLESRFQKGIKVKSLNCKPDIYGIIFSKVLIIHYRIGLTKKAILVYYNQMMTAYRRMKE